VLACCITHNLFIAFSCVGYKEFVIVFDSVIANNSALN
jgi:hypothetical protein